MARVEDLNRIKSKRKAIVTLFQYVVWRGRDGNHRMIDTFLGFARTPKVGAFMTQPIATLLSEAGPDFPNRVVTLMSPYADWGQESNTNTITRWAAAALEVQYTEEIGRSVVDTLLQIASISLLKPYIPIDIWVWLKKQPSLPPVCSGRSAGTMYQVVRTVRELGDVEILKSYFLLVWSEWCSIYSGGLVEMCTSIREDLAGVGMGRHREVLVERLDRVLAQLDMGSGHLGQHNPVLNEDRILIAKGQYRELKGVLLEVDMEALEVLTRTSFRRIKVFNLLTPAGFHRIPLDVRLCPPSPISIVTRSQHLFLVPRLRVRLHVGSLMSPLRARSILSRTRVSRSACRTCRHFRLYTILCATTCRLTPMFLNIPARRLTLRRIPHGSC